MIASFAAAPHRLLFFTGMAQVILALSWWLAGLYARATGQPVPVLLLPDTGMHGFLMVYGVFPFFIFGFLFTVYPRWMGTAPIARRAYVTSFLLLTAGQALLYIGLYTTFALIALALILFLAGWASALVALCGVYTRAQKRGTHEALLNLALALGLIGIGLHLVGVWTGETGWFVVAREAGLWLFLLPVVFLVAHRMIPFFSQSALMHYVVRRPAWGPPLMVVCVVAHVAFELAGLPQWRFVADAPLALAALHLSWIWQFRKSFHARLVAMLHIAFLWLGIGMTLYTLQSLVLLTTGADYFGRAPLHALGIGFLGGMVVAMASRVLLGHSGRIVAADTLTWVALLGLNLAAALRLAAEFLPRAQALLNLLAALAWLAFLLPWAVRYLPLTWRARVDNQPG